MEQPQIVRVESDEEREERESQKRLAYADKLMQSNANKLAALLNRHADELAKCTESMDLSRRMELLMIMSQAAVNTIRVQAAAFSRVVSGAARRRRDRISVEMRVIPPANTGTTEIAPVTRYEATANDRVARVVTEDVIVVDPIDRVASETE